MRNFRNGLTLTELVVLTSIASLVLASVFPALQQNREAARNEVCKSNLQTIGIGALEYEFVNGQFPPYIGFCENNDNLINEDPLDYPGTFPLTQLLPFIGQQKLVDQVDPIAFDTSCTTLQSLGYTDAGSGEWILSTNKDRPGIGAILLDNQIELFQCPADTIANRSSAMFAQNVTNTGNTQTFSFQESKSQRFNLTNYTSNAGAIAMTDTPSASLNNWLGFHGPIRSRVSDGFESIADGAANVVLFGESVGNVDISSPVESLRNIRFSSAMGGFSIGRHDAYNIPGTAFFGSLARSVFLQFGSPHPGVVNVMRADGAVNSVNRNIHRATFGRLCGVADGQPVLSRN